MPTRALCTRHAWCSHDVWHDGACSEPPRRTMHRPSYGQSGGVVRVSERMLNRIREHVARESLRGSEITVAGFVEAVVARALDDADRSSKR